MSKRRVVVTGLGLVTSLGHDVSSSWSGIVSGKSGIHSITDFDTTDFPDFFKALISLETLLRSALSFSIP